MYVIMGGTGHVGSAVAQTLLDRGEAVTIVTRDANHAAKWRTKGAVIAEADVNDTKALRSVFEKGRRAFLLNPPAEPSTDTDKIEKRTIASILAALDGTGLEKVVAESTGGAQAGERLGDLSTLWELEEGLRRQPVPAAINRAAYYMSNWDGMLDAVRQTGKLMTFFPADLAIPMVAPRDLGVIAAKRLMSGTEDVGVRYVEGPARYTSRQVADVFAQRLNQRVRVDVVPRDQWVDTYLKFGFSSAAAESYARMTGASIDQGFDMPADAVRGTTTLDAYIFDLLERAPVPA